MLLPHHSPLSSFYTYSPCSLRIYFAKIWPGAPFVHKDRLLASFESTDQPNPALLYIIYAMALSQTNQVPEDIAATYSPAFFQTRSLWHVQKNLAELKDLFQTVQALAFLTVFETGLSKRASTPSPPVYYHHLVFNVMLTADPMHAYLLTGQALRLSVMLGLHLLDESYDQGLLRPVRHVFPSLLHEPTSYDELEGIPPYLRALTFQNEDELSGWCISVRK